MCAIMTSPGFIPDGLLPTIVTLSGNSFTIDGGTRSGNNLFHSFGQFSVPTGGAAIFNNAVDVQNIFSRVTGGAVSNIDGLLKANGNTNLFLLNPNGILFGQGARLDLGGSLIVSTASAIVFGAQGQFNTSDSTDLPLLTIQPSALWFDANPQPITVVGNSPGFTQNIVSFAPSQLNVPAGKSLVLAGGDVNLVGASIGIDRAQIAITGLANAGQVNLLQTGDSWNVQPAGSAPLANISLDQGTVIKARQGQTSGIFLQGDTITLSSKSRLRVATVDSAQGGTIELQGTRVDLHNNGLIASDAFGTGPAGKVRIQAAESVKMDLSIISVTTYGTSLIGGDLTIDTARLSVLNGGIIGTSTFNSGSAGSIRINASDSIEVSGSESPIRPSSIESAAFSLLEARQALNLPEEPNGQAGDVMINTNQLRISDQGRISVRHEGTGNAGELKIAANIIQLERLGLLSAETKSGGGGNIEIHSQLLLLRDQSQLVATAGGTGNGGNITINSPLIIGLENSDIIANAVQGRGGNVQIATQGIFGLKYRDQLTPENDITASSDFGVNGTVDIVTPGIDPNSGLITLPGELVDPSQQIAQNCAANQGSSFVISGRGGMHENPINQFSLYHPWADLRSLSSERHPLAQTPSALLPTPPLVEAVGWRRNRAGQMELFAAAQPTTELTALPVTCAGGK